MGISMVLISITASLLAGTKMHSNEGVPRGVSNFSRKPSSLMYLIRTIGILSNWVGNSVTGTVSLGFQPQEWQLALNITQPIGDLVVQKATTAAALLQQFEQFMVDCGKSYSSMAEKMMRFNTFKDNLKIIENLTANEKGNAVLGIGPFADLSDAEFRKRYMMNPQRSDEKNGEHRQRRTPLGPSKGSTSQMARDTHWIEGRNRRRCGACWAFSVVAAIEILLSVTRQKITRLSEQQLIDCAGGRSYGCDGGQTIDGLEYVMDNGLALASNYPFTGVNGRCVDMTGENFVRIEEYQLRERADLIISGLQLSPLPMNYHAPRGLQHYRSGVLEADDCPDDLDSFDHASTIVGYIKETLVVRITCGPGWGIKGNFLIKFNRCGIGRQTVAISNWRLLPV